MFLMFGTIILLHSVSLVFLFKNIEYEYVLNYMEAFSVSTLDVFVAFGLYQLCTFTTILLYFYFYSRSAKQLNVLLNSMKIVNKKLGQHKCSVDYDKLKKYPRNMAIRSHVGRLVTSGLACTMWYFINMGYYKDEKRYSFRKDIATPHILCAILISNCLIINSSLFTSTEFFILYLSKHLRCNVDTISGLLPKKCMRQLEVEQTLSFSENTLKVNERAEIDQEQDPIDTINYEGVEKLDNIFEMPLTMLKIISSFDETFSGIVLSLYASALILITSCLYGLASILISFSKLRSQESVIFAGLRGCWCLLIAADNAEKIIRLTKETNHLQNSLTMLKRNLNDILNYDYANDFVGYEHKLYKIYKTKITIFKEELRLMNSPLSPFNAFNVSNRTIISAFASITTYLIVLIQFKVSEFDDTTHKYCNITLN